MQHVKWFECEVMDCLKHTTLRAGQVFVQWHVKSNTKIDATTRQKTPATGKNHCVLRCAVLSLLAGFSVTWQAQKGLAAIQAPFLEISSTFTLQLPAVCSTHWCVNNNRR